MDPTSMLKHGHKRSFGIADILIIVGLILHLLFLIFLIVDISDLSGHTFAWLLITTIIMILCVVASGVAFGFSFINSNFLHVLCAWSVLILFMLFCQIAPLSGGGLGGFNPYNFYFMLGAILIGAGSYAGEKGIGVFGSKPAGS